MAVQPISLLDSDSDSLLKLVHEGPDRIGQLIGLLEGNGNFVKPSKFRAIVQSVYHDEASAREFDKLLVSLERRQRQYQITAEQFLDSIALGLERKAKWLPKDWDAWKRARPELQNILATKSVVLKSKAVDLSFDFERIHSSSRILTDIRPIFDEERAEIIGATITQTLRIQAYSSYEVQEYAFVMSADDVVHLRDSCDNAIKKADLSRKLIEEKTAVDVIMASGDADGDDD